MNQQLPLLSLAKISSSTLSKSIGRVSMAINEGWVTILDDSDTYALPQNDDLSWKIVNIPHNWEDYHGYAGETHGNLHGVAWYRKHFMVDEDVQGKQVFLRFEGVGSIAKVYVNGKYVREHKGGLTGFNCDITPYISLGKENVIAVKSIHLAKDTTLPWACGGCFSTPNTEGSQPFGIHRPVHFEITGKVRVEPFGVHVWTPEVSKEQCKVQIRTEVKNYCTAAREVSVSHRIFNDKNDVVQLHSSQSIEAGETSCFDLSSNSIVNPHLWSLEDPYLHQVETIITDTETKEILDRSTTHFGMRWIEWPERQEKAAESLPYIRHSINDIKEVELDFKGIEITTPQVSAETGEVKIVTSIHNNGKKSSEVLLINELLSNDGTVFFEFFRTNIDIPAGKTIDVVDNSAVMNMPTHWTDENQYLYKIRTSVLHGDHNKRTYFMQDTPFKFDSTLNGGAKSAIVNDKSLVKKKEVVKEKPKKDTVNYFRLNGKQVFLNGTCEYMHMLGRDHAFSKQHIKTKVEMVKSAGFNSFRDAHHPHNLYYYDLLDEKGILCYTQITSHHYFHNEEFRENYREAVREWVKERRNHPCIIVWGLQNESKLPETFSMELTRIVRELDPTSKKERPTTTCNGGEGSDWNVPQDWLGTYGGSYSDYNPAKRFGKGTMVGEYGAWRNYSKHTETKYTGDENDWSEDYHTYLLEAKVRLGEKYRNDFCGQFQWIFATHVNPGRDFSCQREGEGVYEVGPVNGKGVLTCWYEPIDSFYMYRSNYSDVKKEAMVYIASHNWPDRWETPGLKSGIKVYTNCDEVELFNDLNGNSLGVRKKNGIGTHLIWDDVEVKYNVLVARAMVNGKVVAEDIIQLNNLPAAPHFTAAQEADFNNTTPSKQGEYIYRINCGGKEYQDINGNTWEADRPYKKGAWGSVSWADKYNKDSFLGSVTTSYDPVKGTRDDALMHSCRFGLDQLKYNFPVEDGTYLVELYFNEPWYGRGSVQCKGWRQFDVAINGRTMLKDLDIWSEVGNDTVLKKTINVDVSGGMLQIDFPEITSGQAIISAISIARI